MNLYYSHSEEISYKEHGGHYSQSDSFPPKQRSQLDYEFLLNFYILEAFSLALVINVDSFKTKNEISAKFCH